MRRPAAERIAETVKVFGEVETRKMLANPTLSQRCFVCGKHFGVECVCEREDLRTWAVKRGLASGE